MSIFSRFLRLNFFHRCLGVALCAGASVFGVVLVSTGLGYDRLSVWIWAPLLCIFILALEAGAWTLLVQAWRGLLNADRVDQATQTREHHVAGTGCVTVFVMMFTGVGAVFMIVLFKEMLRG